MATPKKLLSSSVCKFSVLLILTLLLVNASVTNADNTANSNADNTNTNANRNGDTNNSNTNTNQSNSGATGANNNVSGAGASASPSPSPTPCSGVECRRDQLTKSTAFYATVVGIFAVVLLPFAYSIYRAIRYSRGTYGPLGLPEGSLRAILAYTLVAFVGFYILASILSFSEFDPPQFLLGVVATVIGFYFGSRPGEEKSGAPARPGTVQGKVTDATGAAAAKATVDLFQSGVKKETETTDDKGNYKFDKVAPGDYEVQASAATGQPSDLTKVTVKPGAGPSVDLKLK